MLPWYSGMPSLAIQRSILEYHGSIMPLCKHSSCRQCTPNASSDICRSSWRQTPPRISAGALRRLVCRDMPVEPRTSSCRQCTWRCSTHQLFSFHCHPQGDPQRCHPLPVLGQLSDLLGLHHGWLFLSWLETREILIEFPRLCLWSCKWWCLKDTWPWIFRCYMGLQQHVGLCGWVGMIWYLKTNKYFFAGYLHNIALASYMGYSPNTHYTRVSCNGISTLDTNSQGVLFIFT